MDFDAKPIGIGNLVNLKNKARSVLGREAVNFKKLPTEQVSDKSAVEDDGVAQLAVDVYETADKLYVVAPLAGVTANEVRIEITDDVVVIEGERTHPLTGQVDLARDRLVEECYFGPFSRSIVLPENIDVKLAKAEFKKGILVLSLPKLDNVRTRIIRVEEN